MRSLSDFRANVAAAVRDVQRRRRPIFLTQHGRGAAVFLDQRLVLRHGGSRSRRTRAFPRGDP
ncbi:MAG: type II toxin-antitoxin system prevent-host-death family antitoxin [Myxococcota bacterium]